MNRMNHYLLMREFGVAFKDQAFLTDDLLVRYLCMLYRVVELDGINAAEKVFMDNAIRYAELNDEAMADYGKRIASGEGVESLLATFGEDDSRIIRKYLVRDAIRAALADDEYSPAEGELIGRMAKNLDIPDGVVDDILTWVNSSRELGQKFDKIDW